MKTCVNCDKEKNENEFSENSSWCKVCVRKRSKKHYEANKDKILAKQYEKNKENNAFIFELKKDKECVKCGYNKSVAALDFHHLDPSIKEFNISEYKKKRGVSAFEDIKKEIEKCVVLCSNCHREFHYLERNKNITIEQYLKMAP